MSRWWKPLLVAGIVALPLTACGGQNPFEAASEATVVETTEGDGLADNDFLPEGQNISSCVGAVERPNCGSSAKGGWRQYLVLGVLLCGLGFIGLRIRKGVKARDAQLNPPPAEVEIENLGSHAGE